MRHEQVLEILRKHPSFTRCATNVSLITCFTISLCSAAYTLKILDEFVLDSQCNSSVTNESPQLNISQIKAIMDQRGVLSSYLPETDVQRLIELTGPVTKRELMEAEKMQSQLESVNLTKDPDALLYDRLTQPDIKNKFSIDSFAANSHSTVFETESEFVERVEDNKDSIWLLAVVAFSKNKKSDHLPLNSIINRNIWSILSHRYHRFGFKMGLLNCKTLHSICIGRGFITADLVLAFPRGGERIKDMVQFRPLPRSSAQSSSHSKDNFNEHILNGIHYWIVSILSERVRELKKVTDIFPSIYSPDHIPELNYGHFSWSNWLMKRPQPVHVLWCPWKPKFKLNNVLETPLVLSALSVPYTGRVRFWTISRDIINETSSMPLSMSNSHLPYLLNCSYDNEFIVITPEGKRYTFGKIPGEFLSYSNMEIFLRFLYPSVDDFLWILVALLNSVIVLDAVIEGGQLLCITYHQSNNHKFIKPFIHSMSTRFNLAKTVIRLARRGWSSHIPNIWLHSSPTLSHHPTNLSSRDVDPLHFRSNSINLRRLIINNIYLWLKIFTTELFSANLLLLLTVLPFLNLFTLTYSIPIINTSLYLLRTMVLSSPMISLRLAILFGYLNWSRFCLITTLFLIIIMTLSTYIHSKTIHFEHDQWRSLSGRSHASSTTLRNRLNHMSLDQLWNEFTRLLVQSDAELRTSPTGSTNSSTTESDNATACAHDNVRKPSSNVYPNQKNMEIVEGARLLRRLRRLYNILSRQGDHIAPTPLETTVTDRQSNGLITNTCNDNFRTAAAHIYTWNCFASCRKLQNESGDETDEISLSNLKMSKARSRICKPDLDRSILDVDCEAEDELDDSSSDESEIRVKRVNNRIPVHRFITPRVKRYHSSSTDSTSSSSDFSSDIDEPTQRSDNLIQPQVSGQGIKLKSGRGKNWPSWVVPCEACIVCWRKFRPGVRLSALPCGHGFHELCIRKWLDTGAFDCPVCRWPAYAPHLRQQCQMVGQLIAAVQQTVNSTIT